MLPAILMPWRARGDFYHGLLDHVIVDLTWDCLPRINDGWSHSTMTATKPHLHLRGPHVYDRLRSALITPTLLLEYIGIIDHYLRREYANRDDANARYAIAKSSFFLLGLLYPATRVTNEKDEIRHVLADHHPQLYTLLADLASLRSSPDGHETNHAWSLYEQTHTFAVSTLRGTCDGKAHR